MKTQISYIREIEEATEQAFQKAEAYFGRKFDRPVHQYDLRGTTAGQAKYVGILRWNMSIYAPNKDVYLARTVPHEVAHLVSYAVYGREGHGHGKHWQHVMRHVMGIEPSRCHSYKEGVKKSREIQRDWTYECACRVHNISTVKHNKMLRGKAQYHCIHCNEDLKFIGKGAAVAQKKVA